MLFFFQLEIKRLDLKKIKIHFLILLVNIKMHINIANSDRKIKWVMMCIGIFEFSNITLHYITLHYIILYIL